MKVGVVGITRGGRKLAAKIVAQLEDATLLEKERGGKVADTIGANWPHYDGIVCVMATGITVRAIAPLLRDKLTDPCVIVVDEKGHHVISLLSGHIGGGNALAVKIAAITGGTPVITTASDTLNLVALDLWARDQQLVAPNREQLTAASTLLVNRGNLHLFSEVTVKSLPQGLTLVEEPQLADIVVSHRNKFSLNCAVFRPRNLTVGIGCNRGTPPGEFEDALDELFDDLHLNRLSIRNIASIDKKNDEVGLLQFAEYNKWQIDFFDNHTINTLKNLEISFAALKAVGAIGVAEPAALLSAQSKLLLSRKRKWKNVTMAVAQAPFSLSVPDQAQLNR